MKLDNPVRLIVVLFLIAVAIKSFAYETPSHDEISRWAFRYSMLSYQNAKLLDDLGLNSDVVFPDADGIDKSIIELIANGSVFEDNDTRPLHHFYDPLRDGERCAGLGVWPVCYAASPDYILEEAAEGEERGGGENADRDIKEKLLC